MPRAPRLDLSIGLASLILSIGINLWAVLQWRANFDGDEAVLGLMSLHTLRGEFTPYFYGQRYLGSLEAILAAAFIGVLGPSVLAFRLVAPLLYGVFLVLVFFHLRRVWGPLTARIGIFLFALPTYLLLYCIYRPGLSAGLVLGLGVGILHLTLTRPNSPTPTVRYLRPFLFGLLAGLGIWIHPILIIPLAAVGLTWTLQTPEWRALYSRATAKHVRRWGWPLLFAPLLVLAVLGFFTSGCELGAVLRVLRLGSLGVLAALGGVGALLLFAASHRRVSLLHQAMWLGAGLLLGNLPQWGSWLRLGIRPSSAVLPSCPTQLLDRGAYTLFELIPVMWGMQPTSLPVPPLPRPLAWLSLAILMLMTVGIIGFGWRERRALAALVGLAPGDRQAMGSQLLALLFIIPIALTALGGNVLDPYSVRFLLWSWYAGLVMLAHVLAWLWGARRYSGVVVGLALWAVHVVGGYQFLVHEWRTTYYTPEAMTTLTTTLQTYGVSGGYADYWQSYPLTFLNQERLIIAPYNGIDRYPRYTERLADSPTFAYLTPREAAPPAPATLDSLAAALRAPQPAGPVFDAHFAAWPRLSLRAHHSIGNWEVWIVERR
ncbi:MAG: hypothetical protein KIT87_22245 [Anaerolineae bacterium]|nr:hypothetical protein [Anaerolineae bacterium]